VESIRQYLLTVISAALLCGIINGIIGKNGAYGTIVKLVSSLMLVLTVISPWTKIKLEDFSQYADGLMLEADAIAQNGEDLAASQREAIIKHKTEAYIQDKATSIGLSIDVDVMLSSSTPPVPCGIIISGHASPYLKQKLQQTIFEDLGIPEDALLWT